MSNEIVVVCPNCNEVVALTVKVDYLFSRPKSLQARIASADGAHTCAALAPKPRKGAASKPATQETAT